MFLRELVQLRLVAPVDIALRFDDGQKLSLQGLYGSARTGWMLGSSRCFEKAIRNGRCASASRWARCRLRKRGALYYLTYASLDRSKRRDEKISYSTAPSIKSPWMYRGELTGSGKYSFTIHPGIAEFKGNWYLFLHNATLAIGGPVQAAIRSTC